MADRRVTDEEWKAFVRKVQELTHKNSAREHLRAFSSAAPSTAPKVQKGTIDTVKGSSAPGYFDGIRKELVDGGLFEAAYLLNFYVDEIKAQLEPVNHGQVLAGVIDKL
jgi:hypothetical protein